MLNIYKNSPPTYYLLSVYSIIASTLTLIMFFSKMMHRCIIISLRSLVVMLLKPIMIVGILENRSLLMDALKLELLIVSLQLFNIPAIIAYLTGRLAVKTAVGLVLI